MATIIDSFTIASSSNTQLPLRSPSSSPRTLSPPISAVLRRSSLRHFSALKIYRSSNQFLSSNLTNSRSQNKFSRRGGGAAIVCEASDTAVDGQPWNLGGSAAQVPECKSIGTRCFGNMVVTSVEQPFDDYEQPFGDYSPEKLNTVPSVTDATWKSLVLESDTPVMVEFWASWCGPCRMILPIIAELSKQYAGRLKCYKLNTDDCPTIATQYGIRSIPTIMVFVNGEKKDAVIGAVPKTTLTACIEKFL